MVVGVAAGVFEARGLGGGEHAEGAADFEAEGVHGADEVEDGVEFGAVLDFAPGGAHAEAGGTFGLGLPGLGEDGVAGEDAMGCDAGIVVGIWGQ